MENDSQRVPAPSRTGVRRIAIAAFVIGAGVMAVEMTASRLLAPYFGASLYVWTSLIVTVLLALSFGYYLGGMAAAKGLGMEAVGMLTTLSAVLLVAGLLVIPRFSSALSGLLAGASSATLALFLGSLVVTLFAFALPVFLMAVAAPIMLKEWTLHDQVGTAAGRYFAVSTGGSVVGTVMPSLLAVPLIGARGTIEAVAATFLLLALFLLPGKRKMVLLVAAALAVVTLFSAPRMPEGVVLERESPYQLIRVAEQPDGKKFLIFNEGTGVQSVYVPGGGRTGFYFDYAGVLPLLRADRGEHRVLILGLAGGSVAARYRALAPDRNIDITGVEVDPAVIEVAREHFGLDEMGVKAVAGDARMFLAAPDGEQYDVIISDAYSTQLYIPPHLATSEFFALAKTRLVPGGVFAMNVNAPNEDSRLLKALVNTVAASYRHVTVVPVSGSWNHLVLSSDEPIDLHDAAWQMPVGYEDVKDSLLSAYSANHDPKAETFTDDRAPIEFLTDAMVMEQAWSRRR